MLRLSFNEGRSAGPSAAAVEGPEVVLKELAVGCLSV